MQGKPAQVSRKGGTLMRVSFDLDEVLFVNPATHKTEPALRFPLDRIFPERLRLGTVKLIHDLQEQGFEVWVYTSSYRTETYIRALFRLYGVRFDGIVNGKRHDEEVQGRRATRLPTKLPNRFGISLHMDDEEAVLRNSREYGFRALRVYEPDDQWAEKILEEANRIRDQENARGIK